MAALRFSLAFVFVGFVSATLFADEPSPPVSPKYAPGNAGSAYEEHRVGDAGSPEHAAGNKGVAAKIAIGGPDIWTGSDGRAVGHAAHEISSRRQLENQLKLPAGLDFGDRKVVALHEIFDLLHEKYGLSIRFDTPVLVGMLAAADEPATKPSGATTQNRIRTLLPRSVKLLGSAQLKLISADTPSTSDAVAASDLAKFFHDQQIDLQHLDPRDASVATVLRHVLESMPLTISNAAIDEDLEGLPILLTNAGLLDYVVENDCVLITSRMNALMLKETRVYSLRDLKDVTPEQLSKVIRESIHPWSWRSQVEFSGDQSKSPALLSSGFVSSLMKTGAQMVSVETGISPEAVKAPDAKSDEKTDSSPAPAQTSSDSPEIDGEELLAIGRACLNAAISTMEMAHYAETPTGTIQVLPGKLVITQSQSAHREIADLLEQLADE